MEHLQDADYMLSPKVADTINALELGPEDSAVANAALHIALNFDCHPDKVYACRWLLPELLKYLIELGATPAARKAIAKGSGGGEKPDAVPVSRLDQLRTARAARRPTGA